MTRPGPGRRRRWQQTGPALGLASAAAAPAAAAAALVQPPLAAAERISERLTERLWKAERWAPVAVNPLTSPILSGLSMAQLAVPGRIVCGTQHAFVPPVSQQPLPCAAVRQPESPPLLLQVAPTHPEHR
jgi:hypothetical protein